MEASVALPMLDKQLSNLHVEHSAALEVYEGRVLFGFKHLPVTFDPSDPL
jgi:hypothetical protein